MIDSDKTNENESHLRGVIEQLQTRNRAMEREARNARAIIGSLKAAMREDSEYFFAQAKEITALKAENEQRRATILKFDRERRKAEAQARQAMDSPDHVWVNQRRKLRQERQAMNLAMGREYWRTWRALNALRAVLAGKPVESYDLHSLPEDIRKAIGALGTKGGDQ